MFLKLKIFLGKEILLEGAGDSFLFNVNHSSIIIFIVEIYLFFAALQSSQADCLPFISAALIYFPHKVPTHIWQLKFTPFDLLAISLFQICEIIIITFPCLVSTDSWKIQICNN